MTREEQINDAVKTSITETLISTPNYEFSPRATDMLECAFTKGAEWADAHPVVSIKNLTAQQRNNASISFKDEPIVWHYPYKIKTSHMQSSIVICHNDEYAPCIEKATGRKGIYIYNKGFLPLSGDNELQRDMNLLINLGRKRNDKS